MSIRVSNQGSSMRLLMHLQTAQTRLAQTQERVTSGRRINQPSDDPFGTNSVLADHSTLDRMAQQQRTVTIARAELGASESVLDSLGQVLARVQELSIQADSSAIDSSARQQIAAEVSQLISEVVTLGNTSYAGRRIFAGQQTQTAPFVEDVPGAPMVVTFAGDAGLVNREVGDGELMPINLNGSQIFTTIFQKIISFRNALNSNDSATIGTISTGINAEIDNVLKARGEIGARTRRLDLAETRLADTTLQLRQNVAVLEEVDLTQEIVDLQTRETALQAALTATGRSLSTSLLDFLR